MIFCHTEMFSAYMYNHYLSAASTFFALRRRFFLIAELHVVSRCFSTLFLPKVLIVCGIFLPLYSGLHCFPPFLALFFLALYSSFCRSCKIWYLLSVFKLKKKIITMWMVHLVSNISNTYQQDTHLSPRYCLSWSSFGPAILPLCLGPRKLLVISVFLRTSKN